jgi:hypothetical protein
MTGDAVSSIRTLRLKVKSEAYACLNTAAIEVNSVWNRMANSRRRLRYAEGTTPIQGPAGRCVYIVNERNTTRTCSSCGAFSGPSGLDMLVVRMRICRGCGVTHDRDVNAARNILSAERCPPSVRGSESPWPVSEPSRPYWRCDAEIPALTAAA